MSESLRSVPFPAPAFLSSPADLLSAAEAEAEALADSLHDGALQALVVARYATDVAVRGGDPALARDAVQEALVALRRTVWSLRPRGADDLPGALHELSGRSAAAGQPVLDLDLDTSAAARLAPLARSTAYRFVQAATAGGAVQVRLTQDGAAAAVTIEGAELADPVGWAARADALGGRLDSPGYPARLLLPLLDPDTEDDR